MKKALVIFLALAMVGVVFAAEPAAEVKVAEFTGNAAVTFGANLDNGKTGFKNETEASLKLNLMNGGDKSTTGDGVWGELKLAVDAAQVAANVDDAFALVTKADNDDEDKLVVSVKTAKIHINNLWVGIKSGDIRYGGDFWYPNALNYMDSNDGFYNRNRTAGYNYKQGLTFGYKTDLFSVEGAFHSKPETVTNKGLALVSTPGAVSDKGTKYYGIDHNGNSIVKTGDGKKTVAALFDDTFALPNAYYTKEDGDVNYWTNKYALGVYGEVKPIKDLRIGVGGVYVLGELGKAAKTVQDNDNKGDFSAFVGVDYRFNFNEDFFIQPTATYNFAHDAQWNAADEKIVYGTPDTNVLNAGVRLGFAKSKSSTGSSLLYSFFGQSSLVYESTDNDKGDDLLLPGVSLFGSFNLKKDGMKNHLPLMLTFYSGELVKGLNAVALVRVDVGPDASAVKNVPGWTSVGGKYYAYAPKTSPAPTIPSLSQMYANMIKGKGVQVGAAAAYDVKVNDKITVVPGAGFLWTHSGLKGDNSSAISADQFKVEAKVDLKGLVDNTTFTMFWDKASFGKGTAKEFTPEGSPIKMDEVNVYEVNYGVIGLKAKIAL